LFLAPIAILLAEVKDAADEIRNRQCCTEANLPQALTDLLSRFKGVIRCDRLDLVWSKYSADGQTATVIEFAVIVEFRSQLTQWLGARQSWL